MADLQDDRGETLASLLALGDRAYRLAYHVAGSADLAEDAVQDAYLDAIEHLPRGLPPEEARAYFLRTAANAARKCLRGESRRRRREAAVAQEAKRSEAPQTAAADRELPGALRAALAGLDERLRLPVALCCQEDLTQREAALVLEVPETTLSGRLREGLESLRRTIQKAGYPAAAGAALIEGIRQATPPVPAGLAAKLQSLLAGAATAGAKVGASTAAAAGGLALGWKLLAGASLAALLVAGSVATWRHLRPGAAPGPEPVTPAAPAAAAPGPETPGASPAVRELLARRVVIRNERMALYEVCDLVHRQQGLLFSVPPGNFAAPTRLTAGEQTVGQVLAAAAAAQGLDQEVVEHRGQAIALFWDRPEPEDLAELRKLAASPGETERCLAARWLPLAGDRESLLLAMKMLGDESRRVRLYAAHGLHRNWCQGFYGWRAGPLPALATPETSRAVVAELERVADECRAETAGRYRFTFMQLAQALGDAAALPALEKIARHEALERPELWEGSTIGQSVGAIAAIGGPEAERGLLDIFEKARGNARDYVMVDGLARLDTPGAQDLVKRALNGEMGWSYQGRLLGSRIPSQLGPQTAAVLLNLLSREPLYPPDMKFRSAEERATFQAGYRRARDENVLLTLIRLRDAQGIAKLKEFIEKEPDPKRKADLCWRLWFDSGEAPGDWLRPRLEKLIEELGPARYDGPRQTAVGMLGYIGSAESVPLLLRLLRPEEHHFIRSRAVMGLAMIGTEPAVARVLECLKTGDERERAVAAQYLGQFGLMRGVGALRQALKDPEPWVRGSAAASLGRLGGPEDVEALLEASRLPGERVDPKTGRKLPDQYRAAARAVEQLGVIGGKRAAEELAKLAKTGSGDALPALFNSRDPDCRRAARALLKEDAAGTMRRLAPASDLPRLHSCAWSRTLPARHAVPALVEALASPDAKARSAAAANLSTLRIDPRAVAPLARLAAEDPDETVRLAAAKALRGDWDCLVDPAAAATLLAVKAKGSSENLRKEAMLAVAELGAAGGPEAAAAIVEYVKAARAAAERLKPQPRPQPQPKPPEPPEVF